MFSETYLIKQYNKKTVQKLCYSFMIKGQWKQEPVSKSNVLTRNDTQGTLGFHKKV